MSLAWAKCPSLWAKVKNRTEGDLSKPDDGSLYLPSTAESKPHPDGSGPLPGLSHLRWSVHKGSGTAAIMLLFALAIRSNQGQRETGRRTDNRVVATYDDLMALTLLSREMIAKGLKVLKEMGPVTSVREGNGCSYAIQGIDTPGAWCQLPQGHLLDSATTLKRLAGMRLTIKRRTAFDAMKLYMLLLAFRENHLNVARVSYETIREYTGMRREEIAIAVQLLQGAQLCRLALDEEVPIRGGTRKHNRYVIIGLTGSMR